MSKTDDPSEKMVQTELDRALVDAVKEKHDRTAAYHRLARELKRRGFMGDEQDMRRWEYTEVLLFSPSPMQDEGGGLPIVRVHEALNDFGQDGWEIVGAHRGTDGGSRWHVLLKRPAPERSQ